MQTLVDGRDIARRIYKDIGQKLQGKRVVFLVFGGDSTSDKFIEVKTLAAEKLGVLAVTLERKAAHTSEAIAYVKEISEQGFDGIVVQLPLPHGIDADKVFDALPQELDIDVLSSQAKDDYKNKKTNRVPPVAGAVEEILARHKIDLKYKEIIVLGKGRLVGEPVATMLERNNVTCTTIDIDTPKDVVAEYLKSADVVVSGIGVSHYVKKEMVKPGSILIDAGTSELKGALAGDIDPECAEVASLFTPVPGGIGPVTVAVLFRNLLF